MTPLPGVTIDYWYNLHIGETRPLYLFFFFLVHFFHFSLSLSSGIALATTSSRPITRAYLRQYPELANNTDQVIRPNEDPPMTNERPKLLKDFVVPNATSIRTSIVAPVVGANNFELKPTLINMVQQHPFNGLPNEDSNLHLSIFLKICNTLKVNGVTDDAIRLKLFPFSLIGKART
jgi:hypothetical protein